MLEFRLGIAQAAILRMIRTYACARSDSHTLTPAK
jgi:hypothetical protein